jgi:hypothetical protein
MLLGVICDSPIDLNIFLNYLIEFYNYKKISLYDSLHKCNSILFENKENNDELKQMFKNHFGKEFWYLKFKQLFKQEYHYNMIVYDLYDQEDINYIKNLNGIIIKIDSFNKLKNYDFLIEKNNDYLYNIKMFCYDFLNFN